MCMETNEVKNGVSKRKAAEHFFDKRLIKEIVQAVEDGLPRIEAQKCYGMSETTLCRWMAAYGSPEYHAAKLNVTLTFMSRPIIPKSLPPKLMKAGFLMKFKNKAV